MDACHIMTSSLTNPTLVAAYRQYTTHHNQFRKWVHRLKHLRSHTSLPIFVVQRRITTDFEELLLSTSIPGNYKLLVTDANGCTYESDSWLIQNISLTLEQNQNDVIVVLSKSCDRQVEARDNQS